MDEMTKKNEMKKIFFILAIVLVNFTYNSQINKGLINKVREVNLLNVDKLNEFEAIMNSYDTITNYECLKGLSTVFKNHLETPQLKYSDLVNQNSEAIINYQQNYQQKMILFLGKIRECNLVDDVIYSKYLTDLPLNPMKSEYFILQDLTIEVEKKLFENDYYLNLFANHLISKKIVDSRKNSLLDVIKNKKIKNVYEFESFCDRSTLINLKDYGKNPIEHLEKIYKKTSSLLFELFFTDFTLISMKNEELSDDKKDWFNLEISLKVADKTYRYDTYFIKNRTDTTDFKSYIDEEHYYQIFNNVLADIGSSYRLKLVKFHPEYDSVGCFSIIALKKNQDIGTDFKGCKFFTFKDEKYSSRMSDHSINELVDKLKNIGLFDHISEIEFQHFKNRAIEYGSENKLSVVQRFPNIFHRYLYSTLNSSPYYTFLHLVDSLSKHKFQFSNYQDNFFDGNNKKMKVSFTVNGKKYTYKNKDEEFWLGNNSKEQFLGFINQILVENRFNFKFYFIEYTEEEMFDYVMLTDVQIQAINSQNLFGFVLE